MVILDREIEFDEVNDENSYLIFVYRWHLKWDIHMFC